MTMTAASDVFDDLHTQIDTLIGTVEKLLRDAKSDAEDAASRSAFSVLQTARSVSHEAMLRSRRASSDTTRTIQEHPLASMAVLTAGIAALAGAIALASHHKQDQA